MDKKFEGAEHWDYFLVEGYCSYGWDGTDKTIDIPDFCTQDGHMNRECCVCPYFMHGDTYLTNDQMNFIKKLIEKFDEENEEDFEKTWDQLKLRDAADFYLAGPPAMLDMLVEKLRQHEVPEDRIIVDAWE